MNFLYFSMFSLSSLHENHPSIVKNSFFNYFETPHSFENYEIFIKKQSFITMDLSPFRLSPKPLPPHSLSSEPNASPIGAYWHRSKSNEHIYFVTQKTPMRSAPFDITPGLMFLLKTQVLKTPSTNRIGKKQVCKS